MMKMLFTVHEVLVSTRHTHKPVYDYRRGRRGFFDSLEEAEKAMHKIIADPYTNKDWKPFCFVISQKPYGIIYADEMGYERLYNPDGTLAEASLFARGFGYGYFPKAVQHRFKAGDMVEFLDNHTSKIRLAIVAKEPLQPSEWYGNIRVYDRYQCLPLGSDKYYSVASIRVMPPHLPVGDLLKAEHEDYLAKAKSKGLIFNQEIQ